jgi:hypothetical protein
LYFAPLAWLKLQWFCHAGNTEVGGFGISSVHNPLYIEEFVTLPQQTTAVTVAFDDAAVADYFDRCVDRGLIPRSFARLWLHTHPGESPLPSRTDEETFARRFGSCDWSVMAILSRTGETYARLAFSAGPGAQMELPVSVHWPDLPETLSTVPNLDKLVADWVDEYATNIFYLPLVQASPSTRANDTPPTASRWWDLEPWNEASDSFVYEPIF